MKGIFVLTVKLGSIYVGKENTMTLGVIGKKVGMTQIFDSEGLAGPVTVIKVDSANGLVLVKGSVPGCEGRLVTIVPTRTKWNA